MPIKRLSLATLLLTTLFSGSVLASQGYYRYPALHNNSVLFSAEGDIWQHTKGERQARRLTSHPDLETQPLLSADGSQLAFVANYDGADEIYLMPVTGGQPKRVSFENSRVRVQQWLADGRILYATDSGVGPANYWLLKLLDPITLSTEVLPLADAASGVIDPASNSVYFVRFGLQLTGDNSKVYRGGAMGQLWHWQLGSKSEARLLSAQHQGSISQPMFWQGRVYFVSDADGNSNIWSMAADGSDPKQHSRHSDWRIGQARLDQGRIIYQLAADLYQLDLGSNQSEQLDIALSSDFVQQRERFINKPLEYLTSASFNETQQQVVLTARSQVAVASTGARRLSQIHTAQGSRSRNAISSPDGKWVYAINDSSGENEIWRFASDGAANAKQLTRDGTVFRWGLHLSPDGRYLVHDDKNGDLWLFDLDKNTNKRIYQLGHGHSPYQEVVWSADSQLLAFTLNHQQRPRSQVVLYSLADDKSAVLTSDKYPSYSPAFSADSLWLYFLSDRQFTATPSSPWGDRNLGPMFDKRGEIYALSLQPQACFAFAPPQELSICDDSAAKAARNAKHAKPVDWSGLSSRLWQVPLPADNYSKLSLNKERLYVLSRAAGGRSAELKQAKLSAEGAKLTTFSTDVADYQLGTAGDKLFIRKQGENNSGDMLIVAAGEKMPTDLSLAKISSTAWQLQVQPQQEWAQMFRDAWLMHRDFLFDKGMRGLDWPASRDKYQPLLARVTDRYELDDVLAQMMGELNALHSQVRGGEYRTAAAKPNAASLGARFASTGQGVKITHIYQSDKELPAQASPLAKPGVKVAVNDLIVAINGKAITNVADLTHHLRNQAGKQVLLTLSRGKQQWQTVVQPVALQQEAMLRYQDWVQQNQQQVSTASDGRLGYLHLYAMGGNDIASFAREFYAQYQKEGLIIDVRRNRGGNIDSWIIEKLLRRAWSFWQPTHGAAYTNMQQAFRGHLVVLIDPLTYSDGETFAAGVKALGLGPVIGNRTTGAGVWLSGRNQLADKGLARVAETPQFAMDGRYIIEGYGVTPDIEVSNLPYASFNGSDNQLTAGVEYLLKQLTEQPLRPIDAMSLSPALAEDILPVNR
ncbi:peptidase S41 [Arsukibacterium ikkense]|uniref:Tricorn protease homolog n=1 Tax=Arsukibacterium ikkense TaxID=336831 RepID=A0A0M2V7X9_9GAMM|nr:S41 family peptidase [Arsukibacterium ikkense]KKO46711.1 peptidase S41 [Arsukibacterium ikkense]